MVLVLSALVLFISWIYYGFGGIIEYIDFFFIKEANHLEEQGTLISKFIGGNFSLLKTQYLLFLVNTSVFIYLGISDYKKLFSKHIIIPVLILILYQIMVYDTGNYSTLILVFAYYLLFNLLKCLGIKLANVLFVIILGHNLFLSSVKMIYLVSADSYRSEELINNFVEREIPENAKVCANNTYYYALLNNDNYFRMFSMQEVDYEDNIKDIVDVYQPTYFLINEYELEAFKQYFSPYYTYEKISEFNYTIKEPLPMKIKRCLDKFNLSGSFIKDYVLDYEDAVIIRVKRK